MYINTYILWEFGIISKYEDLPLLGITPWGHFSKYIRKNEDNCLNIKIICKISQTRNKITH